VNHREVGVHTKSFASALRGALREDPDIILVGELRDLETIRLAVEAASTGHLVFGTLHTTSAAKTVDRIIEVFPASEQQQIRSTLADGIRAVVSQVLFKRVDKKGRCAALEILIATPAVRNLIREAKTHQIPSMIQTGKKYGMQLLDDSISDLLNRGWISADEAYAKANDKARFRQYLKTPRPILRRPEMRKQEVDYILGKMLDAHKNVSDLNVTVGRPFQVESSGELVSVLIDPPVEQLTPFQTEVLR